MLESMKIAVKEALARRGYTLIKTRHLTRPTMEGALDAAVARGHEVGTLVDVGASDGRWARMAMERFRDSRVLLVEAKAEHETALRRLAQRHPRVQYVIAAAGHEVGTVAFTSDRSLGGRASLAASGDDADTVPMVTLDEAVLSRRLPGPYLIKLDTHGFERPILQGAAEVLAETELLVIECYNYRITEDSLLFFEMCDHLLGLGFRCIDLANPRYRPYDDSFWQADLVFARSDRPGFSHVTFR